MDRFLHTAAATLFGLIAAAQPLAAQASEQPDLFDVLIAADDDGDFLRITTTEGRTVEGYIRRVDADVLRLGGGAIELHQVERVEVRRMEGRRATTGIVVGGLVGGLVFGTLAMFAAGMCEYSCSAMLPLTITAAGVSLGSIVGGMTGAALGPGEADWTVRWSR